MGEREYVSVRTDGVLALCPMWRLPSESTVSSCLLPRLLNSMA